MLCHRKILVPWLIVSLSVLASPTAWAGSHGRAIGVAETVVGDVYGDSLLRRMQADETLIRDQRVRAGVDSAADLRFLDKSRLQIGPRSELILDRLVYDSDANAITGTLNLVRGVLRFASSAVDRNVTFETSTASIGIRGTMFDLMATDRSTEIKVHEGRVEVDGPNGTVSLSAGQSLVITATESSLSSQESASMHAAVSQMLALAGDRADRTHRAESGSTTIPPTTDPGDGLATALAGRNPDNLLYLDLSFGRVVIEMRQDLAPRHVARIKQLVRAGFYDGLNFHVVQPGRFAMTGDPSGSGRGGSGTALSAEFSGEPFRRGSVGMARDRADPDSADSQFFISLDAFPEIDGQYTLWGQVIYGMALIDRLRVGSPPADPDMIVRMRVAADLAG